MERYTMRLPDDLGAVPVSGYGTPEIIDRLAAYEDTGLTPTQIKYILPKQSVEETVERMKAEKERYDEWFAWKQAETEGRLVVLPCKTVFEPTWDAGKDCDLACPVLIDGEGYCNLCEKAALFVRERPCKQDDIDRLGKTAFRTREEAETKLKELGYIIETGEEAEARLKEVTGK